MSIVRETPHDPSEGDTFVNYTRDEFDRYSSGGDRRRNPSLGDARRANRETAAALVGGDVPVAKRNRLQREAIVRRPFTSNRG